MLDAATYTPRLKADYKARIRAALKEEFGYKNDMQLPRLDKIVLNMGVGEAVKDTKKVKTAAERADADRRPEGRHHPRQEVDRRLPRAGRDAAWRARSRCAATGCTNSWTV